MALTESDTHSFPLRPCKPTQLINWLVTLNVLDRPLVQYHLQSAVKKKKYTVQNNVKQMTWKPALEITPSNI